jgi:hypothetical protein
MFLQGIGVGDSQKRKRRLITLISAGRNRIIVIRRELPRTENADPDKKSCRTKDDEVSPFRVPLIVTLSLPPISLIA